MSWGQVIQWYYLLSKHLGCWRPRHDQWGIKTVLLFALLLLQTKKLVQDQLSVGHESTYQAKIRFQHHCPLAMEKEVWTDLWTCMGNIDQCWLGSISFSHDHLILRDQPRVWSLQIPWTPSSLERNSDCLLHPSYLSTRNHSQFYQSP